MDTTDNTPALRRLRAAYNAPRDGSQEYMDGYRQGFIDAINVGLAGPYPPVERDADKDDDASSP